MTINDVGNNLIVKVVNITINDVRTNLIGYVKNLTIKDVRNDLNGANTSDLQVQLADNPAKKTHQNLLSSQNIGIRHEEVPVLDLLMEPNIGANNQTSLTTSTEAVKSPKALKTPVMEEVIMITTAYNTRENRTPWRVSSTDVDVSNPFTSVTRDVDGDSGTSAVFTSPPPPYCCIRNLSIGNIRQTTTPIFRKCSELNTPIGRKLTNDLISPSIRSQIICD